MGGLEPNDPGVRGTSFCGFSVVHELPYACGWAEGRVIAIDTLYGGQSAPKSLHFAHKVYNIISRNIGHVTCMREMVDTNLCSEICSEKLLGRPTWR